MRDFSKLADAWPSPVVAREAVGKFSGGLLNPRTMANIDSLGKGPKMVRLGRKRGYWVDSLIEWMNSRMGENESLNKSMPIINKNMEVQNNEK